MSRRAILIVLDGVGAGAARDAAQDGDEGSNTLANVADALGGVDLPALESLGLGKALRVRGMRDDVPVKYRLMTRLSTPMASKICAPQ